MSTYTRAVPAKWTDDCQGKKDFDGCLVTLSTRYWPRGGGFGVFGPEGFRESSEMFPQTKPSAKARIYLGSTAEEYYDSAQVLAEFEVEADTQQEVQQAVEEWAQQQFDRIGSALMREFGVAPGG